MSSPVPIFISGEREQRGERETQKDFACSLLLRTDNPGSTYQRTDSETTCLRSHGCVVQLPSKTSQTFAHFSFSLGISY